MSHVFTHYRGGVVTAISDCMHQQHALAGTLSRCQPPRYNSQSAASVDTQADDLQLHGVVISLDAHQILNSTTFREPKTITHEDGCLHGSTPRQRTYES